MIIPELYGGLGNNLFQIAAAYALAKEVCAADFHMQPAETEFLALIEEIWAIPKKVTDAVNQSIKLRYFT